MATIEVYVTGDEIGTFSDFRVSGQSNGTKLTLDGVQPLGTINDTYRIVLSNVDDTDPALNGGEIIEVYAYPDTSPPSPPIYSGVIPDPDEINGRISSNDHQVVLDGSGGGLVIDLNGVEPGSTRFGPGNTTPLGENFSYTSLPSDPPSIPCFTKGTLIETPTGPLPVECLRVGDPVMTLDHGEQPIRWIGQRSVAGRGSMAPITVAAGALGNHRRLRVSPQHRILVGDWRAQVYFGRSQVLVAAKHLVNGTTIRQTPVARVSYVHFAFDSHQVVFAEGIPTESLHLGAMALSSMDRAARDEICAVFPELAAHDAPASQTARTCLRGWEGQLLAPDSMMGVLSPAA
ncbi:MAG: Hint domain-containing protein [Rhodobacteraceae bacterium]|nr:Hint domain-containing protein [Paracoccaceae bacterium]